MWFNACAPVLGVVLTLAVALPTSSAVAQAAAVAPSGLKANAPMTDMETAWLLASIPVVAYGKQQGLPLDVVVQPQPTPGLPGMGMAFDAGRCKLVVSMRGNPQAQALHDRIPPALWEPVVQAIVAHELAHCWRHVHGAWGRLPAGFTSATDFSGMKPEDANLLQGMWRTRREEGFADLVGLAWTLQHHPQHYTQVHTWLTALRSDKVIEGAHHDTRAWVRLAHGATGFGDAAVLFDRVEAMWARGLLSPP